MIDDDFRALSERFDRALLFASDNHREQRRKGTTIPAMSHLLGVASLVMEDGGSEDEVIAALLHDAAEDPGPGRTGRQVLADIRARFGDEVADIVLGCSDTLEQPKPPWRPRKEAYIEHVRTTDNLGTLRVSLGDKVHNARSILADYRTSGDRMFGRFNASKDDTLWYYRTLVDVFEGRLRTEPGFESRLVAELRRTLDELTSLMPASR